MIPLYEATWIFWGTFYTLATWVLFHWFYRDYRTDVFRQKLFNLRDELFRLAAGGELTFESHAYGMTRMTINGFIRFADELSLVSAFLMAVRMRKVPKTWVSFDDKWNSAVGQLEPAARDAVSGIIHQVHRALFEHLVLSSLLFWALVVPVLFVAVLDRFLQVVRGLKLWPRLREAWLYPLDDAALTAGRA